MFFNLFKKKPEEISDLDSWISTKSDEIESAISDSKKQLITDIEQSKSDAIEKLQILQSAELQNKNIPSRALQAMEGNREAYVRRVNLLLDNIALNDNLEQFFSEYEEQLKNFSQASIKSYQILQHFFANESRDVSMVIKSIDHSIGKLKKTIKDSKQTELNQIKQKIADLNNCKQRKQQIKDEVKDTTLKIEQLETDTKNIEQEITDFTQSEQYTALLQDKSNLENVQSQLHDHNDILIQSFGILGTALKKYARISEFESLINKYLENPISAIQQDTEMKIKTILSNLRNSLEKGGIQLKDQKLKKSLETLKSLQLDPWLIKFQSLDIEASKIEEKITANPAKANFSKLKNNKTNTEEMLESTKQKLTDINFELEKLDENTINEQIHELLKQNFNIQLTI